MCIRCIDFVSVSVIFLLEFGNVTTLKFLTDYWKKIQYSQRHTMINHCDRRITLLSDTDTVQSETYHDKSLW